MWVIVDYSRVNIEKWFLMYFRKNTEGRKKGRERDRQTERERQTEIERTLSKTYWRWEGNQLITLNTGG